MDTLRGVRSTYLTASLIHNGHEDEGTNMQGERIRECVNNDDKTGSQVPLCIGIRNEKTLYRATRKSSTK